MTDGDRVGKSRYGLQVGKDVRAARVAGERFDVDSSVEFLTLGENGNARNMD